MALTDVVCRTTKPRARFNKLSDSGGLQLWVQPNGSKLWRFAYRFGGKQKVLALGAYARLNRRFPQHQVVNHSKRQYVVGVR